MFKIVYIDKSGTRVVMQQSEDRSVLDKEIKTLSKHKAFTKNGKLEVEEFEDD